MVWEEDINVTAGRDMSKVPWHKMSILYDLVSVL